MVIAANATTTAKCTDSVDPSPRTSAQYARTHAHTPHAVALACKSSRHNTRSLKLSALLGPPPPLTPPLPAFVEQQNTLTSPTRTFRCTTADASTPPKKKLPRACSALRPSASPPGDSGGASLAPRVDEVALAAAGWPVTDANDDALLVRDVGNDTEGCCCPEDANDEPLCSAPLTVT